MLINPIFTRSFCPWSLFESEDFLDLENISAYSHNIRHANSFLCGLFGTNFRKFLFRFRQGPIFFSILLCYVQTKATTPNIVGPTMLGVVASVLAVVYKQTQRLPTIWGPAVHRGEDTTNTTLETWIRQPYWRVHGPNNVGRAVQTSPTLLRYTSSITEQNDY